LFTVTVTAAEVVVFPAASLALAVRVWEPFVACAVFQLVLYGLVLSVAMTLPSMRKSTEATPTLSEAEAEMVLVPETVAPFDGAVRDTVGGVVSGAALLTVTVTPVDVVVFPAASRARALRVWPPLAAVVVFQETL